MLIFWWSEVAGLEAYLESTAGVEGLAPSCSTPGHFWAPWIINQCRLAMAEGHTLHQRREE